MEESSLEGCITSRLGDTAPPQAGNGLFGPTIRRGCMEQFRGPEQVGGADFAVLGRRHPPDQEECNPLVGRNIEGPNPVHDGRSV